MYLAQKIFANRWIAGPDEKTAISTGKKLSRVKIKPIFNYLGEEILNKKDITKTINTYLTLLDLIKEENLNCSISIKPTQIGSLISKSELEENYAKIIKKARKYKVFTWLDMESYKSVDSTISLYLNSDNNSYAGICLQSYLRRTIKDAQKITKNDGIIRLVKGAYSESKDISYNRTDSTVNYLQIMKYLFKNSQNFMLATHDLNIIKTSFYFSRLYKKMPDYAMLYGIRNKLAVKLAKNHNMYLYVPFGTSWLSYSYRRLRESSNVMLVLRSLLDNQKI